MALWSQLLSDWVGILSLIVLAFIGVMAGWFMWFFRRSMHRDEAAQASRIPRPEG